MRHLVTALLVLSVLAFPVSAEDVSDPGKVNKLLTSFDTPLIEPGQVGAFSFTLHNPYSLSILMVEINVSIYRFATVEEDRLLDENWPWCEPFIKEAAMPCSKESKFLISEVSPGESVLLSFVVVTSREMPHGNPLSEGAFFVRFWLTFDLDQGQGPLGYVMASRGYFSDDLWEEATAYNSTNPCTDPLCRGNVNLGLLNVDGILPDSSFGVREPIPTWPFYLLLAIFALSLVFALLYYAEEHPGRLPRIEVAWLAFKNRAGKIYRARFRRKRTS